MMELDGFGVRIEAMSPHDIGDVLQIERVSFSTPWTARAYEYELRYNDMAHYYVARANPAQLGGHSNGRGMRGWLNRLFGAAPPIQDMIVGYVGFWLMAGEAHVSTIAVKPELRGLGLGELLLIVTIEEAVRYGAHVATLEVRFSNQVAQDLYLKYGFEKVGLRKAYYSDNNEDAFIMTTPTLGAAAYQQKFQRLKRALQLRLQQAQQSGAGRESHRVLSRQ